MTDRSLTRLMQNLARVDPADRIDLREPVLAFGVSAIGPLRDLAVSNADLVPSIVAWLEVLANRDPSTRGAVATAIRSLAGGAGKGSSTYALAALERLGFAQSTTPRTPQVTQSIPSSAGTEWTGFQIHEFGRNAGTHWRSATGRQSLAPIITRGLQALDTDFMSYGVERSPEVHFALTRRYRSGPKSGFTASKLVVYAHGPTDEAPDTERQVVAGWYIERGDGREPYGPSDNRLRWDWPLFLEAVEREPVQIALAQVMERHQMAFGDYPIGGKFQPSLGWTARVEAGEPVARNGRKAVVRGWRKILERLQAVSPKVWIDLHLWRSWPAEQAIGAGQVFAARELLPVLTDVGAVYLQIVGGSRK